MSSHRLVPGVLLLWVSVFAAFPAAARQVSRADMHCKVSSVHDGDSLRVRCPGHKKTIAVRLDQIDAPEIDQAYGIKSRDYLRKVCPVAGDIVISQPEKDQYNRTLGYVHCDGVDVNAAMVKSGSAWVYDHYVRDKSLYALQQQARSQGLGLWENQKAIAPWKFRRK